MVKHYTTILPFKPPNWVLYPQPATLEEVISLMETYASAEAGLYLIPKACKKKGNCPSAGGERRSKEKGWGDEPGRYPEGTEAGHASVRAAASWCFTCGQPGHFQRDHPHMDCFLIKTLRGLQVGMKGNPDYFTVQVGLSEQEIWALVDMGCGRALVRRAMGPWTPEILRMKCIHRNVREYRTKQVCLWLLGRTFRCQVGVVPLLDCPVLLDQDCPLLQQKAKARWVTSRRSSIGVAAGLWGVSPFNRTGLCPLHCIFSREGRGSSFRPRTMLLSLGWAFV